MHRWSLDLCTFRSHKAGSIDIRFGYAAEEIVRKAKDDGADLIVLGTHGRRGIRLLLGSTADRVLHHAPCNVLAIRIVD
ncbi:universal stress protein [uncultured Alcanivorax sp.]|uniref:universal stress protein n=1 Tax=uncultured Alcanivorax sp. TaxID=191215 RepID=UPI00258896F8|nr:universal stress protein [uncultured Alcanivorax sp.]